MNKEWWSKPVLEALQTLTMGDLLLLAIFAVFIIAILRD